jgi:hypothetical protein
MAAMSGHDGKNVEGWQGFHNITSIFAARQDFSSSWPSLIGVCFRRTD